MAAGDGKRVIDALTRRVERVVRRLGTEVIANLAVATPKDTGWASGNWIGSIGAPVAAPDGAPGTPGVRGSATLSGASEASAAAIARWRMGQGRIYVTNRVPYVVYLDAGTSAQAPAGFVRASIIKAIDTVRGESGGGSPIPYGAKRPVRRRQAATP